jgi:ferredoxin
MVFMGVRPCDLHAIKRLDAVFKNNRFFEGVYKDLREKVLLVVVNCTRPGGTCFCVSMDTGPKALSGFDISLTEVISESQHFLLAEAGSRSGMKFLLGLALREASKEEKALADKQIRSAAGRMGRELDKTKLSRLFDECFEHPRWEETAGRCLTCGNCTMVCPTCFCFNVKDVNDLAGEVAERWREWDSCFTRDFSYIHGGSMRNSAMSRYRQWVTHKLCTWVQQFGSLGCVGCGRCITWCPVGIDITLEAKKILGLPAGNRE